jgi:tryptophan synthase beta chain
MQAYADYFEGKLTDHYFTDNELSANLAEIEALQPTGA